MTNNTNIIIFLGIGAVFVAIAIGWIIKKFFSVNAKQLQATNSDNKKNKPFISKMAESDGSSGVINESNNSLSKKSFDGVNLNPKHLK
ncbi:MAG: hypothetical protein K0R49_758 [Burkholderiales bacterium]|jgi:uncharacterized membrane protein YraQ (UPF0718 family)|nr:hypothetical protein [Burkholderiales bacterium]